MSKKYSHSDSSEQKTSGWEKISEWAKRNTGLGQNFLGSFG